MDTGQNNLPDYKELELERAKNFEFDLAIDYLERLDEHDIKSHSDNGSYIYYIKSFVKKQRASIEKLNNINRELAKLLEESTKYQDVVVNKFNETQIRSAIQDLKYLVEDFDNNSKLCSTDINLLETSHEIIESIFEENKTLKNNAEKYKRTLTKQADRISVLHRANEMYEKFINFNRQIKYVGFITALIAFIFGVTAFLSVIK